jgi:hypothetical protein
VKSQPLDLGLSPEDERAIRDGRRARPVLDPEGALRLMAEASPLVDPAVRRRPLLSGVPFTLPGHREPSGG